MTFEARADCPTCRVEGARFETWADDELGVPNATRCRVCGEQSAAAETPNLSVTSPARVPAHLDHALTAWAMEEGLTTAAELVEGYFVPSTQEAILAALARAETVETTFDVVDLLVES